MKTTALICRSLALAFLTTGSLGACSGLTLDVGSANPSNASAGTCPVAKCEEGPTSTIVENPKDSIPGTPLPPPPAPDSCTYYDGVQADGGQWWSSGYEVGWSIKAPAATSRAGKKTNLTCAPSQFAAQGSMPADACAWKYLCERVRADDGVVARLEEPLSYVVAMAADATALYLGNEHGRVFSIPKVGGLPRVLVNDEAAVSTPKTSVAVDEAYVYFSNLKWKRVARVPKGGGAIEVLADHLEYPRQIALDATHLYITVENNAVPGTPPTGTVVRVPKTGGLVEVIASEQLLPGAIVLSDTDVYFSAQVNAIEGSVRQVAKSGGAVKVLASGIGTDASGIERMAIAGDKLAVVDQISKRLVLVPLTGAPGTASKTSVGTFVRNGLASSGATLFAAAFDEVTAKASLLRLDGAGVTQATLAEWSYVPEAGYPGNVSAAAAMLADVERVYWVDFDRSTKSTTAAIRSTIRSAKLF